jgi:hypothetical protein
MDEWLWLSGLAIGFWLWLLARLWLLPWLRLAFGSVARLLALALAWLQLLAMDEWLLLSFG